MTAEEETALRDEQEGPEFDEAEKAFEEKNKRIAAQQSGEETKVVSNPKDLPYTAKENQQILIVLGFTPHYHDKDKEGNDETNFGIRVMNMKIGVKFNDKNPAGLVWAYELTEDNKKDFYKNGDLNQIPLIQKYRTIQEGKEPIPEITVIGKIVEKRGKALKVEIEENGETKEIFFGQGAVKRHDDGHHYIPAGFSKPSKEHDAKMDIPRDIRLPDYETQLAQVPVADTTKEKDVSKEKREPQPTEKGTFADTITPQESIYKLGESTEYTEAIAKYTAILAEVTEAIFAEDRIPSREKGYGVKFVFDEVVDELKRKISDSTVEAIAKVVPKGKISEIEKGDGTKQ